MPELLLSCQSLTKAFGASPLFENLSFGISEGDHIGVVGPNGSGKSTLLKILADLEDPSSGIRAARKRLRLGYVPQDPVFEDGATVGSILESGARTGTLDDHEVDARVSVVMARAGFDDPAATTRNLSGGWRKRLAIARELAREPDLILLDEPTNHLDVEGILWLEEVLKSEPEAFLAVSHDRYFLEAVAGRIIELNRAFASGIFEVRGRYSDYLLRKDEFLAGQESYQDSLRNRVRGELEWLSRKARARTRKSQARIADAGRLIGELSELDDRSRRASVDIEFSGTERKTRRLVVASKISKSYGDRRVLDGLDLVLSPGSRIGLLGANGSGKTTLLRILAGTEAPDSGTLERAGKLRIVTFDQHRSRLEPGVTLRRSLAPSGDSVVFQGRAVHVAGWAKRFLFRPEALDMPVDRLSGGEQARVVLARLMLEPADLLLLDEPTNDLDIPTLELLEESLMEFPGAIVLVTHDRYLLDRISTRILALSGPNGRGAVTPYSDFAQWESAANAPASGTGAGAARGTAPGIRAPSAATANGAATANTSKTARLGYKDKREFEQMEARILAAEKELARCMEAAADPAVASDHKALAERHAALDRARIGVDALYARWAVLEAKGRIR